MWLGALLPVVGAVKARDVAGVSFGPQNCVTLSKTPQGSCEFHTNCDGVDLSEFDFSFVCLTRSGDQETQVKHEYGKGGWDADEDYDTEVPCDECLAEPKAVGAPSALQDAHAQLQQYSQATAAAPQTPPPKAAAFYGPEGCIAAYRSSQGTCIVQTRCTSQASSGLLKDYNYGLTCVDDKGASTRHLFGKNSFDAEETFDTLVECQLCLGFDGATAAGNATDASLAEDVASLQTAVKELQEDVKGIKDSLGLKGADKGADQGDKGADAGANATAAAEPEQTFLHKFRHHYAEPKPVKKHRREREEREEREEDLDADDDLDDEDLDGDLDNY